MSYFSETEIRKKARRLGFEMKRNYGFDKSWNGYVIIDRAGNGIIRATPATLEDASAFLNEIEAA